MKVKVKTVRALLVFVTGLLAGSASAALTHTAATIDTRADLLAKELPADTPVKLDVDDDGQLVIILSDDITDGLALPADLGPVTIDLNGWSIKGPDGDDGTGTTSGKNGGAAITVAGACGVDAGTTKITVKDVRCIGVQLWENGPIFAECNVGAARPEETGWYFWWGDTVGYTNVLNKAWKSVEDDTTIISFDNSTPANSTYGKNSAVLKEDGWIDASGNLVATHDAATKYIGAPWRMPTAEELEQLTNPEVCTATWTADYNQTGVKGYVVQGKEDPYKGNEVFFPVTGYGTGDIRQLANGFGSYWGSTPSSEKDLSTKTVNGPAYSLNFTEAVFFTDKTDVRFLGSVVRPVCSASNRPASGDGPAEIVGGNGGDGNWPGKGALPIVDADGKPIDVKLEIEPESVRPGEDGNLIKSPVQVALEEAFEPNAEVKALHDETTGNVTNYEVTVTNDITGPVVLPEIVDEFILDLGGFDIVGADGERGSSVKAGGDGSAALVVSNASVQVSIVGPGSLKGGNGGDGHGPGSGAPAIASATGAEVAPASVAGEVALTPGRDGTLLDPGIQITRVQQLQPWNGRLDVGYTIEKLDPERDYELTLIFTCEGRTATIVLTEGVAVAEGDHSYVFDGGEAFADIANATITVRAELTECVPGAVRLWPRGPFFAQCNLGAESPEMSGAYFWWGDTVGYRHNEGGWRSVADDSTIIFNHENPIANATHIIGDDVSALRNGGWIDENDNLTPGHDAAAVWMGDSWRMPTHAELEALVANCAAERTASWNGTTVSGYVFTGRNEYAGRSIFIPAAGYGNGDSLPEFNETGDIWAATRCDRRAWELFSGLRGVGNCGSERFYGRPVRPVNPALVKEDTEEVCINVGGGSFVVDGSVLIRAVDPAADGKWAVTFSLKLKDGAPAFDVWMNSTAKAGKFKLKVAATAEGLAQKEQTESVEVSNVRLTEKGWVTFDGLVENAKPKYFKVVIED